ncbi:MAG: hypothetical protein WCF84_01945 [Anaerolineae bacterium]
MVSKGMTVERAKLPPALIEWLEVGGGKGGILLYREENGQIVLEKLENVDPAMLPRLRANMERYRSALERLADS